MSHRSSSSLLLAPLLIGSLLAGAPGHALGFDQFVTHRDGKLYEGGEEFRFVSWNIPNLHCIEDSLEFLGGSPWRWPNEFEVRDALKSASQMGGRVARCYVISVRRDAGDMGDHVHVLAPGEFNERAFQALDLVLKIAEEEGVRVIIPLVDNWRWWGGARQYEAFRDKPNGAFWTDPQIINDFKQTIAHILNRRNTLTGRLYRDDPAVLAWETGNELDAPPAWTREIAACLKRLDPNHLVIDGRSLHGVPVESLSDPNIDVVTTHHYPNAGNNNAESVLQAARTAAGRKAYLVGEFGFIPLDEARRVLDAVIESHACGALYWSLRFHRREGGFYWHDEPSGAGVFKAYHWPGFREGAAYRELEVMSMLRDAAFRIRGQQTPPLPIPAAPRLLPSPRAGLLTWQGAAGASGYDVQRSTSPNGPWKRIAHNVSDAAVQYRPLLADETAEPGAKHYYRVVARNRAGKSQPSNTLGPLIPQHRLLVDEFFDASRLHAAEGDIEPVSENFRQAHEDLFRLRLQPGSWIDYRLPSGVEQITVWAFAHQDDQAVTLSASRDGVEFQPLEVDRSTSPATASDYTYLRPLLLDATPSMPDACFIRIALPPTAAAAVQLSRVELRYGGQRATSSADPPAINQP